jgi:hypothetical protein
MKPELEHHAAKMRIQNAAIRFDQIQRRPSKTAEQRQAKAKALTEFYQQQQKDREEVRRGRTTWTRNPPPQNQSTIFPSPNGSSDTLKPA